MRAPRITRFPMSRRAIFWCTTLAAIAAVLYGALARGPVAAGTVESEAGRESVSAEPIPLDGIGAAAGRQYDGDGLAVVATSEGARLTAEFQHLEADVTASGLTVRSTEADAGGLTLRAEVIRRGDARITLPATGVVAVRERAVTFTRPGVTEEYSTSVDGVRQDVVVAERLPGTGGLTVELALSGATAAQAGDGVALTLDGSGRGLTYNRLHVVDAEGQVLTATLAVLAADRVAVQVDDTEAAYPVRIDPTFSDADWISLGSSIAGVAGYVMAVGVDSSGHLYIGGYFTVAGTVAAENVAKWDGSAWSALGSGVNGQVFALTVSGTDVYVGGWLNTAGGIPARHIAKWNGNAWSALGSGVNSAVDVLAVDGTHVYAGGSFSTAGGIPASGVAKWDGSAWSALGSGVNGTVTALAVSGTDVYVGGYFMTAGEVTVNRIAKWDGSAWSSLGSGVNNGVEALAVIGTDVYVGGWFTTAGGGTVNRVAKWNGSGWWALGSGLGGGGVSALAVSGTDVYAGGYFSTAGGVTVNQVAKWDGSAWSAVGSGVNNTVLALAVSGSDVYVGGHFSTAGGGPASRVAKWDSSAWVALGIGTGVDQKVNALAVSGTDVYVGGHFSTAGGVMTNHVAKWDGSGWSALGSGVNSAVWALAVSGTDLYVGGAFTTAGGVPANRVAKWDGSAWSALGSGVSGGISGDVYALAVSGADVYVGGWFTSAGGVTVNRVAKWDGSAWWALGSGVDGAVRALAVSGANVYVGGDFTTAGGVTASRVAKWDGSAWSALGSGVDNRVQALTMSGADMYVGGAFTMAGGVTVNRVAKWDGSAWSALGGGVNNTVQALAVSGTDLYVGGGFWAAGGVPGSRVAKWDGSGWSALGSGVKSSLGVHSLAVDALGRLVAGGDFSVVGTTVSTYIALADLNANHPPVADAGGDQSIAATSTDGAVVTLDGSASADADEDTLTYTWIDDALVTIGNEAIITATVPFGTHTFTLTVKDGRGGVSSDNVTVTVFDSFSISITAPQAGASFAQGQSVTASYTCSDSAGILASCVGPTASGTALDTSIAGAHEFTVTATNTRGDTSSTTVWYAVTNNAPTFIAPANQTVEATSASGAAATYAAMGTDVEDGGIAAACAPASGATFPLGTTSVNCTVTDVAGATAAGTFTVTVVDTTAPTIVYSGNAGTYEVSDTVNIPCVVTDAVGVASSTCVNIVGPGTSFQVGENTVTSTASDAAGNTTTASVTFTVVVTSTGLQELITEIAGSSAGQLIQAAQHIASAPNATARTGRVTAFKNQVNAQLKSGKITAAHAALLITLVDAMN